MGLRFDLALLHVGGNDVVADTPLHQLAGDCDTLLQELGDLAVRTAWLGPPDLGLAPLFPRPYAGVIALRSRAASQVFSAAAARHNVVFVDFSAPANVAHFRARRRKHFSTSPSTASIRTAPATVRLYDRAADARAASAARLNQSRVAAIRCLAVASLLVLWFGRMT